MKKKFGSLPNFKALECLMSLNGNADTNFRGEKEHSDFLNEDTNSNLFFGLNFY